MSRKKRQDYWRNKGGFAGIPRRLMEFDDYKALSGNAVKLLVELCGQYKGNNNGDLSCEWSKMKTRGFNSDNTVNRAKKELIEKNFIEVTRYGMAGVKGRRVCTLYALTFHPIDEIFDKNGKPKLDVASTRFASRKLN